jgi:hypothetical protein
MRYRYNTTSYSLSILTVLMRDCEYSNIQSGWSVSSYLLEVNAEDLEIVLFLALALASMISLHGMG